PRPAVVRRRHDRDPRRAPVARQRPRASERRVAGGGARGPRLGDRTGSPAGVPSPPGAARRRGGPPVPPRRAPARAHPPGARPGERQPEPRGEGTGTLAAGAGVPDPGAQRRRGPSGSPLNSRRLSKRLRLGCGALLVLACIVTYANGIGGDFTYDDKAIVRDKAPIPSPPKGSQILPAPYFGGAPGGRAHPPPRALPPPPAPGGGHVTEGPPL